jgi:uncharacterized membrane protein
MSDVAHHEAGPGHRLERLVFFSDAVIAIAITLLVIELHAPHVRGGAPWQAYVNAVLHLLPNIFGFVVSFFVIGAFWAGHHRAFALAATWDERLTAANLLFLLAIVALPFFTAFMSGNADGRVPALLYAGWLLFAALMNMRLQRMVTAPPVVAPHVPLAEVRRIRRRGVAVALGALSSIVACALAGWPGLGLAAMATIPLWRRLLDRLDRPRLAAAADGQADEAG